MKRKDGRPKKHNPSIYRYTIRLDEEENANFLALYDRSGIPSKAEFIRAAIFQKGVQIIKIDKDMHDFHLRLTAFYSQFRSIGVNYNQVVKQLNTHFTQQRAMATLYKLEKSTVELVHLNTKIVALANEFEQKWLQKS